MRPRTFILKLLTHIKILTSFLSEGTELKQALRRKKRGVFFLRSQTVKSLKLHLQIEDSTDSLVTSKRVNVSIVSLNKLKMKQG